ncbi:MAG TPA: NADAR family protein [Anaerolineales bacterium]|nr:NADAR family protein [Anaerolineales bacterium]
METEGPIDSFQGEYRFLSNFWPCKVEMDGQEYASTEHAYQASKFDRKDREPFLTCTPGAAKRMGRGRVVQSGNKLAVMEMLVRQKFSAEPLRSMLLATGDRQIIEGNTWGDVFWGVCGGVGANHLGILLMQTREELRHAR